MITDVWLILGLLGGASGIVLGARARRWAIRAAATCAGLAEDGGGSRGTVDPRALRDVGLVRYDALHQMSGQLSLSIALLNAAGDGVVLSSINGRSETRTYAKVVLGGIGARELSPAEAHAVRSARLGTGLPLAPETAFPVQACPPGPSRPREARNGTTIGGSRTV